jgi:hypothetical protein
MTQAEFQRDDREYERQRDHREELEREDIMSIAVDPWLRSFRIAAQSAYAQTTRAFEEGAA